MVQICVRPFAEVLHRLRRAVVSADLYFLSRASRLTAVRQHLRRSITVNADRVLLLIELDLVDLRALRLVAGHETFYEEKRSHPERLRLAKVAISDRVRIVAPGVVRDLSQSWALRQNHRRFACGRSSCR